MTLRLLLCAILLAGCTGTGHLKEAGVPDAAYIQYAPPAASAKLTGSLVLSKCTHYDIQAAADFSVVSAASADTNATFRIAGADIQASLEKRSLTVELYDTGTLKSINTSAADQSGTVITNVVKTIASFAGVPCLFGCAPSIVEPPPLICNMETMLALYQVKALDEAISSYKDYLIEADPDDLAAGQAETLKTTVDYLIAQKASLVEKDLTIKVSKPIDLVEGAADIPIRFTLSDLGKWLSEEGDRAVIEENSEPEDLNEDGDLKRRLSQCLPHELKDNVFQSVLPGSPDPDTGATPPPSCESETTLFSMSYSILSSAVALPENRASSSLCRMQVTEAELDPDGEGHLVDTSYCRTSIAVIEPAKATLIVKSESDLFQDHPRGEVLGKASLIVPQWGQVSYVPIDVGFGRNRTLAVTLDKFGRKTGFTWNSEARAANLTGSLASTAEAAKTLGTSLEGDTPYEELKAESDLLELKLKLNAQRKCQTIIDSGGTKCPEAEDSD